MDALGLSRPHSSAVERYVDNVEVAGSIPAVVTDVRFFGYKHWTLEDVPRCFYVGKGLRKRPYSDRRSDKWHAIVQRFGLRVEICVGPVTDVEACDWEIRNIVLERTFSNDFRHDVDDIGCNFTAGGDGVRDRNVSADARKRIGDAQRGKPKDGVTRKKISDALKGRKLSDETRQKMSQAHFGVPLSETNKQNLWINRSRSFSDDHRQNLSLAAKNRKCGLCKLPGHKRTSCPTVGGASEK